MGSRYEDDDEWVGTPPEGHVTRDRADPGHWTQRWTAQTAVWVGIAIGVAVVVVLALLM
jgi:hypothetical protein